LPWKKTALLILTVRGGESIFPDRPAPARTTGKTDRPAAPARAAFPDCAAASGRSSGATDMKKVLPLGLVVLVSCGCDTMSNTDKGLLAGGGLGAGAGALLGSATGHAGAGALIGGAAGALIGGLAGNAEDHHEAHQRAVAAAAAANARPPLTLTDVVQMTQQHVDDSLIINQIRTTGSVYNLTAEDITWLKQQGVGDPVVAEMQARRPGWGYEPVPGYVRPVYVVEDPPPVRVGVGFGYYGGRCWR
jgi:hypothetical protein